MTTFRTGNRVPSSAAKDLYDNAENLDEAINGASLSWKDRTGRTRISLNGALTALDAALDQVVEDADAVLSTLGYLVPVPYEAGLDVSSGRFTVDFSGNTYAPVVESLPFVTGVSFDASKWRLIQGLTGSDLGASTGASLVGFRQTPAALRRTTESKLRERGVGVGDFSSLQTAIDAAPSGGEVTVPAGTVVAVAALPSNQRGVRLAGQGKALVADAYGGQEQFNSYRYTTPVATGKEYLWAVYNVMQATNRPIRCYLYGDSTVEGGFNFIDWNFFLQSLLPDLVSSRGVRNRFAVTNRGVGGSNLSTWNPTPDIGVNSVAAADLVIVKCGINDASFPKESRLDTFRENLRLGLERIRSVQGGDVGGTAILVVGPNATIDKKDHARNPEWYEAIRGLLEAACRDFKCAFFDAYAYLTDVGGVDDSLWAKDRWLDTSSSGAQRPVSLHPKNVGQAWLWGAIVDWVFGSSEVLRWSGNRFYSNSPYYGHPYAANPPTWFPVNYSDGLTTEIARAADGFPIDGMLTTMKSPEGLLTQTLSQLGPGGLLMTRTAVASDNFWGIWSGRAVAIGTEGSSFAGGWSNFGGSYGPARAVISPAGVVTLDGMIKPGTTAAGTNIIQLPTGMSPGNQRIVFAASDAGMVQLEVLASGILQIRGGVVPTSFISLTGVSFRR